MTEPTSLAGRYAVYKKLGEGGQATTFEAVDEKVGRPVVVKSFRVRGAQSWKEVELAEREAKVLASLSHPLLPRYVDHFEEGGVLYLVTEKIEGESLAAILGRGGRFGPDDLAAFLRDTGEALEYLHGRSPPIVHRDIKPSNVLRRADGRFVLIDFGAVRDRMKPAGGSTVVGTFGYMAPEQFQGRAMPASDVYGVASTALVMLTGVEPENLPHKGLAIDVGAALAGVPGAQALARALSPMLEPDPDRRARRVPTLDLAKERADGRNQRDRRRDAERAERDRRRDRHEAERDARREWRETRRAERRARRDARRDGPFTIPWPIALMLNLGLTIAMVAVAVSLRAIVPLVLSIMSLAFGRPLLRAAERVRDAGARAGDSIGRARRAVAGKSEDARIRVEPAAMEGTRVRIDASDPDDEAAAEEEAAATEARRRS